MYVYIQVLSHGRLIEFIDLINSAVNAFINVDRQFACRILLGKERFERRCTELLKLRNYVCVKTLQQSLASCDLIPSDLFRLLHSSLVTLVIRYKLFV